ncbi:MAG: hypothetical protein HYV27_16190 [Candidatus Hydrogenedentes bacterium]|nr:hypothetical protein [Candidatus Hydrogenedentota bacterium]
MRQGDVLRLSGMEQAKLFMTAQQYRAFTEKFLEQVRPELDKQREARLLSEEAAKRHLVR